MISSKADVDHSASRVNSLPAKQETFRRFLNIHAFLTLSFKVFTDVVFPLAVGIPSESDYFKRSFSSPYLVTLFPSEGCDYAVDTEIVMHKRTGFSPSPGMVHCLIDPLHQYMSEGSHSIGTELRFHEH